MTTLETMLRPRTEEPGEPMHVFHGRGAGELIVEAYPDHVEIHEARNVVAVWYRNIQGCLPSDAGDRESLAIITRDGQVLLVPMSREESGPATWLIEGLRETAEARRRRAFP